MALIRALHGRRPWELAGEEGMGKGRGEGWGRGCGQEEGREGCQGAAARGARVLLLGSVPAALCDEESRKEKREKKRRREGKGKKKKWKIFRKKIIYEVGQKLFL
jgi:hypothetical protein